MYVVGVSSKLSNTIFTYNMCCLSFLSPLASIFPPFFHRQEAVWLLFGKQGHLNTPDQLWPYCCSESWIWGVRRAGYIDFWTILICHSSHPRASHSAVVRPWAHAVLAVPAKLLWHFHPLGASAGAWPSACHPSPCADSGLGSSLKPDHWIMQIQISSGLQKKKKGYFL